MTCSRSNFDRNGEVSLPSNIDKKKADELLPTMDEQQAIKAGFGVCRIPASCSLPEIPTWSQQIGYRPRNGSGGRKTREIFSPSAPAPERSSWRRSG